MKQKNKNAKFAKFVYDNFFKQNSDTSLCQCTICKAIIYEEHTEDCIVGVVLRSLGELK